ncbi:MAG: YebC/PmpR family DNA-binding transcriptional regulator [Dethiobacteria bacterium]|nr:YebC/PmpR family DNA-binding transcriptional regulator [Bacillota bacterium]NMD33297.1 YebC/PmpR family DNA-binding transcriptional regulator [Bacillota bacterium]HOB28294.1 YebC/PmpR family DNA-binding transcriptional regulator [Bacillota bacterium]HPZ41943.1 YebC/PmpR family DNA-binding transcriptional regulator [Bacillota bacterium]HQD51844.1 YebC/PmpR family DNA-binding transcriptional regulator [Bacillota bacterium]
MAGHSKWANIKRRKARVDAQKGKIFTKLAREIIVAAREGGDDIETNFSLRLAVQKARENNMPNDNIQRAIQRGSGGLEGESYDQVNYEGYAPGGVAVLLEALTDNRNRTVAEVRHLFSRYGGSLGESGCVAWMFERKGLFIVKKEGLKISEDDLMLIALEAGAEDIKEEDDTYSIITSPELFEEVKDYLQKEKIAFESAEVTMLPQNTVEIDNPDEVRRILDLMEALEDNDDIQNVYANFEIPDALME